VVAVARKLAVLLRRLAGTDLTKIDGIDVMTAATILSEAGWDMTKWKDESRFVSWLRLSPDNRISGDRIIGKGRLPTTNRITVALKLAASGLRTSQSYLGAQFRRFRARLDTPVAIKAMAAKLARLVYRMLRYGIKYVDHGAQFYEVQQRIRDIRHLKQKAAKLGFQLLQASAPAA
jgi:transposase